MYLDSIVVLGLVIVALTCAMLGYVGFFAYKHIKADIAANPANDELTSK